MEAIVECLASLQVLTCRTSTCSCHSAGGALVTPSLLNVPPLLVIYPRRHARAHVDDITEKLHVPLKLLVPSRAPVPTPQVCLLLDRAQTRPASPSLIVLTVESVLSTGLAIVVSSGAGGGRHVHWSGSDSRTHLPVEINHLPQGVQCIGRASWQPRSFLHSAPDPGECDHRFGCAARRHAGSVVACGH